MSKIKRFKLKDGVTRDDLIALHFRNGGTWIKDNCDLFLSKYFYHKKTRFEYSIGIAFSPDIYDWNDFDNVLVLDEDFGQPYTPFYNRYGEEVTGFPVLETVINNYNAFISGLGIFEAIK